jgi:hypothetical protein
MLRTWIRPAVLAATLLSGATAADAVVIDFNSVPDAGPIFAVVWSPYVEDGFQLTSNANGAPIAPAFLSPGNSTPAYVGSRTLYDSIPSSTTTLKAADSSPFNLVSIDLSKLYPTSSIGPVTFTGALSGGGTVSQTFVLNGTFGLDTFFFVNFTNLAFATWIQGTGTPGTPPRPFYQFDNIVVTATAASGRAPTIRQWARGHGRVPLVAPAARSRSISRTELSAQSHSAKSQPYSSKSAAAAL